MDTVNIATLPFGAILLLAVWLDLALGDPARLWHPVQGIGWLVNQTEPVLRVVLKGHLKLAGVVLVMMVVGTVAVATTGMLWLAWKIHPVVALLFQVVGIALALSINSLAKEGVAVRNLLRSGDLEAARQRAQRLVSRDLSQADEREVVRATLESMAENLSDGVVAPLLFAVMGGLPGIWLYKAINTLDSMVGYKDERFRDFGLAAAKLDDIANYIPARVTGALQLLFALFSGDKVRAAAAAWRRDARKGPSPNGGIPIVVFAGAVDISLGGDCREPGSDKIIPIPQVGGSRQQLTSADIDLALSYHYSVSFLAAGLILLLS